MNQSDKQSKGNKGHRNPWSWIPTLYLAEGLPLVLIMYVSTVMYTSLGISATRIAFWTSILYFAWVIKPLWGPLVDLYWTKRRWSVLMQILMGLLMIAVGLSLQIAWWWWGSLAILAVMALLSATHDIAADGFYMDALHEKQQSFFVGIRSTFYRLAVIFGQGILVIIAGMIIMKTGPEPTDVMVIAGPTDAAVEAPAATSQESGFVRFNPSTLHLDAGSSASIQVTLAEQPKSTTTITLRRVASSFWAQFFPVGAEANVDFSDSKYEVLQFGPDNWNAPQEVVIETDKNMKETVAVPFRASSGDISLAWGLCFGGVGALMFMLGIFHFFIMPKPPGDGAAVAPTTPFIFALLVMAAVVVIPVAIYTGLFLGIEWGLLKGAKAYYGETLPFDEILITFLTIAIIVALGWMLFQSRSIRDGAKSAFASAANISNVPFDEVFASFFAKPGIKPMIAFLLLFRLGEALLVKMSPIFLLAPVADGGLGLSVQQQGLAYGTFGVVTMTMGGILGGLVASRYGLKRWLIPFCIAINIPDALYIYLAYAQPEDFRIILACVAGETFGYGFGFTAYMLYMLYIAGSGEHKTSHFAICTGFMALGMMLPGMVSGQIADSLKGALGDTIGWTWFFIIVCIATIPGFIMLSFIPLDKEFGRRSEEELLEKEGNMGVES